MKEAFKLSERAFSKDEVPIGAVVVLHNRIIGKGYGESSPIEFCELGCNSCSDNQNQKNRRTEFIILDIGDKDQ